MEPKDNSPAEVEASGGTRPVPPAVSAARRRGFAWALVPTLAAMGLLIWVGTLRQKVDALQLNLSSLALLYKATSSQLQQANENLRLLSAADAVQVAMGPQAEGRKPRATAIYSPSQSRVMLLASELAPLPPGKAYQLWIVPIEGELVSGGTFRPDERGNALLLDRPVPAGMTAKAFAVSIEDEGGAEKPTLPMVIAGSGV